MSRILLSTTVALGLLLSATHRALAANEVIAIQKDPGEVNLEAWNAVDNHKPVEKQSAVAAGAPETVKDDPANARGQVEGDCVSVSGHADADIGAPPAPPPAVALKLPATASATVTAKCHFELKAAKEKHDYTFDLKPHFTATMKDAALKAKGSVSVTAKIAGPANVDLKVSYNITPNTTNPVQRYHIDGSQKGDQNQGEGFNLQGDSKKAVLPLGKYTIEIVATITAASGEVNADVKLDKATLSWR